MPVTYLILFVSTLLLISVTYVFAVQQVNNRQQSLRVVSAQQDMTSLDNNILSLVSQSGAASSMDFRDSGGQLNIEPSANNLTLTISDNASFTETVFNAATGQAIYNLAPSESANIGLYLQGDSATITNQSGASLSQLYINSSLQGPRIQLGYRPEVTYACAGTENGQAVTDIRIYLINLNSSSAFSLGGELPLKISCLSTQLTSDTYQFSYQIQRLQVTSNLNGFTGSVFVPTASTVSGALVNVQVVICNIAVQEGTQ